MKKVFKTWPWQVVKKLVNRIAKECRKTNTAREGSGDLRIMDKDKE